ncbi:multidrug efflux system protein EmrA [Citrobacter koseri]|uniref:Multidrug efflux system protein EmrA n=1 Tax=Citrobacter koseri TaxID=545 RepID=A0A2X2WNQ4_CITKO|nr:multidrug efflux system protein EmrA [Citrobacter koseri]
MIVNRGERWKPTLKMPAQRLELAQIDLQNTRIVAAARWPAWADCRPPRRVCHRRNAPHHAGAAAALGYRNIKETQLAELRVGQPVRFTVDALNDRAYEGRVESISPATGVEFSAITPG